MSAISEIILCQYSRRLYIVFQFRVKRAAVNVNVVVGVCRWITDSRCLPLSTGSAVVNKLPTNSTRLTRAAEPTSHSNMARIECDKSYRRSNLTLLFFCCFYGTPLKWYITYRITGAISDDRELLSSIRIGHYDRPFSCDFCSFLQQVVLHSKMPLSQSVVIIRLCLYGEAR